MEFAREWLGLISLVIVVGGAIWGYISSPSKKTAEQLGKFAETTTALIEKLDTKFEQNIAALHERIGVLERENAAFRIRLESLPTQEAFHQFQLSTERMNSDIRVISETLKGVKETSNLMRDWLLEKGVQ